VRQRLQKAQRPAIKPGATTKRSLKHDPEKSIPSEKILLEQSTN
jgi:hypothetical protein